MGHLLSDWTGGEDGGFPYSCPAATVSAATGEAAI